MWKKTDTYDAYGPIHTEEQSIEELTVEVGIGATVGLTHDWRGKRLDPTGYMWMGSRYYEPGSGRFISPDPYGHEGSIDLYSYANGNPVYYCDADGRFASAVYEQAKENPVDAMQYGLDAAGMIPLFGIAPDLVNALVHSVRGNNVDAMLSLAAAVPIVGDVGRGANIVSDTAKMAMKVGKPMVESRAVRWGPLNGPGPLGETVAKTFRGGSYSEKVLTQETTLYRVYGGTAQKIGPYWSRTQPTGPLQSKIDNALNPAWGNSAKKISTINVPAGTKIYEGFASP